MGEQIYSYAFLFAEVLALMRKADKAMTVEFISADTKLPPWAVEAGLERGLQVQVFEEGPDGYRLVEGSYIPTDRAFSAIKNVATKESHDR